MLAEPSLIYRRWRAAPQDRPSRPALGQDRTPRVPQRVSVRAVRFPTRSGVGYVLRGGGESNPSRWFKIAVAVAEQWIP